MQWTEADTLPDKTGWVCDHQVGCHHDGGLDHCECQDHHDKSPKIVRLVKFRNIYLPKCVLVIFWKVLVKCNQ